MPMGLNSAVSGIRANQTALDVISNNIANVNTLGFKSSSANFATVFSNTITGGTGPNGILGGTNPEQIGTGTSVSQIAANFSQGGIQSTGKNTDMLINGEGFFAVQRVNPKDPTANGFYLTRAGNFTLDKMGNLVTASGERVRGTSQVSGSVPSTTGLIQIPTSLSFTKEVNGGITQNIFVSAAGGDTTEFSPSDPTSTVATVPADLTSYSFGTDGSISASYEGGYTVTVRTNADSQAAALAANDPSLVRQEITVRIDGLTFSSGSHQATDGTAGTLTQSTITPAFTGGTTPANANAMEGMQLQMQTASVINPNGLIYDGNNNFEISPNSGDAQFGTANSGSRGSIQSGALESSNVDLAGQFTNMIVAQRGLEASSKMVRTQSDVLQTIIQMV